jgi:hypothetical protein
MHVLDCNYDRFKTKWEETKPIRGRVQDVRPIGKRNRDWEQVVRMGEALSTSVDGSASYGAMLYATVCVEYFQDGAIVLRNGGHNSPSTARFISDHSPFSCFKASNQLWVRVWDNPERSNSMLYPVGKELRLVKSGETYVPDRPIKINTRRIDREKAKAARAFLNPFLDFTKTFLKMSDGWVMHETRKEVLGWGELPLPDQGDFCRVGYLKPDRLCHYVHFPYAGKDIYESFKKMVDEEKFIEVLCMLVGDEHTRKEVKIAEQVPYGQWGFVKSFTDVQTDFAILKRMLYKLVDNNEDVHKIVEVDPKSNVVSNVVI